MKEYRKKIECCLECPYCACLSPGPYCKKTRQFCGPQDIPNFCPLPEWKECGTVDNFELTEQQKDAVKNIMNSK